MIDYDQKLENGEPMCTLNIYHYLQYVYLVFGIIFLVVGSNLNFLETFAAVDFCIITLLVIKSISCEVESDHSIRYTKYYNLAMLIVINAKLLYFMRLFESLGFIVTMLVKVINQLKGFLVLFIFLLVTFTYSLMLFSKDNQAKDSKVKIPFFLNSFSSTIKLSLGDTELRENFDS